MSEEGIEAFGMDEEVYGSVQCYNCDYCGRMEGIIKWNDQKFINFICPECKAIERVRNWDYIG